MPNIIRRPRSRLPERRSNRPSDAGTHLTYAERRNIYYLSQNSRHSQRAIASALQLPRSTVQSTIYAMTGRSRKQQLRKQNSAMAGSSAAYIPCAPHSPEMQSTIPQISSYYPSSTKPTVSPTTTYILDGHPTPPLPGVTAYSWDNINSGAGGKGPRLASLSTDSFEFYGFDAHRSANFGVYLLPRLPKLTPIEPRIIYEESADHTSPSSNSLRQTIVADVTCLSSSNGRLAVPNLSIGGTDIAQGMRASIS